jgi:glutamyl-tRNA synthetase
LTMCSNPPATTRLAPSPTGALHLGNARTFLINWALARQRGWQVLLRMEDLDRSRVKREAAEAALGMLKWLGLDWDGEVLYQSSDLSPYHAALRRLDELGRLYHCACTRKDIAEAQSAPHGTSGELRYPGTCRPDGKAPAESNNAEGLLAEDSRAWRLRVPDEVTRFVDEVAGPHAFNVQQQAGDFVVATKAGLPAYQLAVAVDDARQGVTDVFRGDDLLASTARQLWIYDFLELSPRPRYWHLPLVLGPDGRRLAKRHGDTRLTHYHEQGVPPERIVGLIAHWCGLTPHPEPMSAGEFCERFAITALPREPVVVKQEELDWLEQRES